MSIQDRYNKTAIIKQHDGTLDNWGKPDYSAGNWDTIDTQKGLFRQLLTKESFKKGKETFYRNAIFYTYYNENINEAMRIEIDSIDYEIIFPKDPNSMGHHMEVSLLKII